MSAKVKVAVRVRPMNKRGKLSVFYISRRVLDEGIVSVSYV